jgi:hypothetical protein
LGQIGLSGGRDCRINVKAAPAGILPFKSIPANNAGNVPIAV